MADFMDSYNAFVDMLNDGTKRKHLEELKPEHARTDAVFHSLRSLSDAFQGALTELFFNSTEPKLNGPAFSGGLQQWAPSFTRRRLVPSIAAFHARPSEGVGLGDDVAFAIAGK